MSDRFTDQEFWKDFWSKKEQRQGFDYVDDLAPWLPHGESLRFLEIGCNPGGILASFGKRFGYELNGVDFIADPVDIEAYLKSLGLRVGSIERADALTWEPSRKFDVVGSFGFIEHFENALEIADRHFRLVKPGGHVTITMPNFARGQWILHRIFDAAQLAVHNTKIMNLRFFREVARRNHATLLHSAYAGGHFEFWPDHSERPPLVKKAMWKTANFTKRVLRRLPGKTNPFFSPYLISVFRAPG